MGFLGLAERARISAFSGLGVLEELFGGMVNLLTLSQPFFRIFYRIKSITKRRGSRKRKSFFCLVSLHANKITKLFHFNNNQKKKTKSPS